VKRRTFLKAMPLAALAPAALQALYAKLGFAKPAEKGAESSDASGTGKGALPDYAGKLGYSDMTSFDADGKPRPGFKHRSSKSQLADPKAPYRMPLTKEELGILNGSKGPEMAKVMAIVVAHGNAFGAEKLVDLGGAPHSSLFTGQGYLVPVINMLQECADAGLKAYAPYTVNPRCYDLYNVENNVTDMEIIYEGYKVQRDLDWVHAQLGAPDLNYRSCICYADEVGNRPAPGTYVAWAESSAVNYGNSALGLRTNRNASGMELLCALLGKAPLFGLMTDEGRMSSWLVEVKTSKEPDWGVVGTAIGRKVVDANPYITGLDKYLGNEVTNDNMHLLKKMGSATAAAGAVGLYHVENVTPDAKQKGRDLLMKGYQTYVIDDAEQARQSAPHVALLPGRGPHLLGHGLVHHRGRLLHAEVGGVDGSSTKSKPSAVCTAKRPIPPQPPKATTRIVTAPLVSPHRAGEEGLIAQWLESVCTPGEAGYGGRCTWTKRSCTTRPG
jgi:predicted aconitase